MKRMQSWPNFKSEVVSETQGDLEGTLDLIQSWYLQKGN